MAVNIPGKGFKHFDGTNFQGWKAQIEALFEMNEVLDVVNGTRVKPAVETGHEAECKKWSKDNATGNYIILSSLADAQQACVLSCATSKEKWDKLCSIHEEKTAENQVGLLEKFLSYKMGENDTAIQHVSTLQNLATLLKDIGAPVTDALMKAKILNSLNARFRVVRIAWASVHPDLQTVDKLCERLIREDAAGTEDEDAATAFVATKRERDKKKPRRLQKDVKCYRCQEMGHFARECRNDRKKKDGGDDARDCAFVVEACAKPGTTEMCGIVETGAKLSVLSVSSESSAARGKHVHATGEQIMAASQANVWLIDSGASRHVSYRREWFSDFRTSRDGGVIALGDNEVCDIVGEGTVHIKKLIDGVWRDARIERVLYVPKLRKNLFSVGVCTDGGYEVHFRKDGVKVLRDGEIIATGKKQGNAVCRMFFKVAKPGSDEEANIATTNLTVWHERLGHVGKRAIRELVKKGMVNGVSISDETDVFCEPCQLGKSHRLPFKRREEKVKTRAGEMFHTDVCGPMSVNSIGGARYFLTFKDDASGFRFVYFLKQKSQVFERFKVFEKIVANKFGRSMRVLRSDNGREFRNKEMSEYLASRGITLETTAPYSPEQNGRSERDNRTIVESARTMIHAKGLPLSLWAEAVSCAVYVLNRTVWSSDGVTPYEAWVGKVPSLKHLRIFGSDAYVHVPKQFTRKLDARSEKMIFVGYKENSANYRVYDPATGKVRETHDVVCNERIGKVQALVDDDEATARSEIVFPEPRIEEARRDDDEEKDEENVREAAVERAENAIVQPEQNDAGRADDAPAAVEGQRNLRDREKIRTPRRYQVEIDIAEYVIPNTYKEAVSSTEAAQWAGAIKEEFRAHEESHTWSLVPRTSDMKLIDSRWVFRVKTDAEGGSKRFKARLCARGFLQREGIDYTETFAPVVRYDSLRALLAIVALEDLELTQFDVQTAFLYGKLEETIFMEVPEGLDVSGEAGSMVCKLEKSLYGLKQSPRCWNKRFIRFLNEFEFSECEADRCVFVGRVENEIVYLALFVDDGLVAANNRGTLSLIVKRMGDVFKIMVGDSSRFVGLQISRDRENKSLIVHQSAYTRKIIQKFGMSDAKVLSVPADPHVILSPSEFRSESSNVPYREAVGSLVFLAAVSRPDISFAVNSVSKFLANHNVEHWCAVKRIFAYLKGTVDYGIEYRNGGSESGLIGFSDADYAGDMETRRSTTGYVFCFANGAITWSSQRQKLVTLSTTEAEYVAASAAARESVWLRRLLSNIGYSCEKETTLFVDNQSAIQLVKNPVFHRRTKHIDVHYHFIREKVESRDIAVVYVPSEKQKADILTKALPRDRFRELCSQLSLVSVCAKRSNGGSNKF